MSAPHEPVGAVRQRHVGGGVESGTLGSSGAVALGATGVAAALVLTAVYFAADDRDMSAWWPLLSIVVGGVVAAAFGTGLVHLLHATAEERAREPRQAPADVPSPPR